MSYTLAIAYVNRDDLLLRALTSVEEHFENTVIIDNSGDSSLPNCRLPKVLLPIVPLSASQSINALLNMAKRRNSYYALFMHSDAEAVDDAVAKLLTHCAQAKGKWAALFTAYDSLVAFNMAAIQTIGYWDINLPAYFSDNDWYRRARLAGYECRDTGIFVKHEGSATINADPKLKFLNSITFPLHRQYYSSKWGGEPGHETYSKPWNGELERL